MGRPFDQSKEVTTSDVTGARMTVPPGVYYRGEVMTKEEARDRMRRDFSTEVLSPYKDEVERDIEAILDVTDDPDD